MKILFSMIDKNLLLAKFSSSMGNTENNFIKFCIDNKINSYKELILEFGSIQSLIYDHIFKITEPNKQLTYKEIETISKDYCKDNFNWIDNRGLVALNRWLIWMCWHEGILKKE